MVGLRPHLAGLGSPRWSGTLLGHPGWSYITALCCDWCIGAGLGSDSPEAWSTSTLELMMCPKRLNMSSRSCWLTVLGSPLMYRLASLIMSELGRANDTWWGGGAETEQHQSSVAASIQIGTKNKK